MDALIACFAVFMVVIAVPLVFFRPVIVFYLMIFSTVFGRVFYASIFNMNNLGAPKAWQPADFLFFLTLIAAVFVRRQYPIQKSLGRKLMWFIFFLSIISTVQGFLVNDMSTVLPAWRQFYFVAPMIFALKYLDSHKKVNHLLLFFGIVIMLMFLYHSPLRFGLIMPGEAFKRNVGQLEGGRGELMVAPVLYLALAGIGLTRVTSGRGRTWLSIIMIFGSLAGVALAETRTLHGAVAAIFILMVLFQRGKIKSAVLVGAAAFVLLAVAVNIGFDIFQRWRTEAAFRGGIGLDQWRKAEYRCIAESYLQQPYFFFTGRGIGARHYIATMKLDRPAFVYYWHSEFLAWMDVTGVIGMVSFLAFFLWTIWTGLKLIFCKIPFLQWYGSLCLLVGGGLFLHSIFSPSFMNYAASSVYACLFVTMANWKTLYQSVQYEYLEPAGPAQSDIFYDLVPTGTY